VLPSSQQPPRRAAPHLHARQLPAVGRHRQQQALQLPAHRVHKAVVPGGQQARVGLVGLQPIQHCRQALGHRARCQAVPGGQDRQLGLVGACVAAAARQLPCHERQRPLGARLHSPERRLHVAPASPAPTQIGSAPHSPACNTRGTAAQTHAPRNHWQNASHCQLRSTTSTVKGTQPAGAAQPAGAVQPAGAAQPAGAVQPAGAAAPPPSQDK